MRGWSILAATLLGSAMMASAQEKIGSRSFGDDVAFLKKHVDVVVLGKSDGAQIAIVPQYQGRVMTSTAGGSAAPGFGWINDELIASGKTQKHINVFGGEDRFWMGPEGGQYAIFFKPGDKFDLEHWQTPACIDTDAYKLVSKTDSEATFGHRAKFANFSGTEFDVSIDRTIRLLSPDEAAKEIGVKPGASVKMVAYETNNTITNEGSKPWTKESGLLSIWILGMYKHSPATTVVVPFREGPESELGPIVNDTYFGKVPADRLKVDKGVIYFKADGQMRTKIGVNPRRSLPTIGSYDASRNQLTIVQYTLPPGATDYVNSMWEMQKDPYGGDVVNSYNDGPPQPGAKPLGPFYELETSSPAAALAPDASLKHTHRTFHFEGSEAEIDALAKKLLGVGTAQIRAALK